MVWLLPDLGLTPAFSGTAQQGPLSQLSSVFNQELVRQLGQIDAQIIPLNVPLLLQESVNAPQQFGLAVGQNLVGTCYKTRCTESTAPRLIQTSCCSTTRSTPPAPDRS
jgi:outer membrane lipase/esterase